MFCPGFPAFSCERRLESDCLLEGIEKEIRVEFLLCAPAAFACSFLRVFVPFPVGVALAVALLRAPNSFFVLSRLLLFEAISANKKRSGSVKLESANSAACTSSNKLSYTYMRFAWQAQPKPKP